MKTSWKAMLAGLSITALAGLAGCAPGEGSYGYYDDDCGPYGCPPGDYDLYYGGAYYDGDWYDDPLYYRDFGGTRQYWIHGGWRRDQWRGPRPEGHRGHDPSYYRDHGGWPHRGGGNVAPPSGGGDGRGFGRGDHGANNAAPPSGGGRGFARGGGGRSFGGGHSGGGGGHGGGGGGGGHGGGGGGGGHGGGGGGANPGGGGHPH